MAKAKFIVHSITNGNNGSHIILTLDDPDKQPESDKLIKAKNSRLEMTNVTTDLGLSAGDVVMVSIERR